MWKYKVTGNMTLSVLDQDGFQVVKVDLLSYGGMKAGNEGVDLAKMINNLTIIASFSGTQQNTKTLIGLKHVLPHPEVGYSPLPWSYSFDAAKNLLIIRDCMKKKIAERKYPFTCPVDQVGKIIEIIDAGIECMNSDFVNQ